MIFVKFSVHVKGWPRYQSRRHISENFNRLSRAHERYRRQTDGRATANSERELAKNGSTLHVRTSSVMWSKTVLSVLSAFVRHMRTNEKFFHFALFTVSSVGMDHAESQASVI